MEMKTMRRHSVPVYSKDGGTFAMSSERFYFQSSTFDDEEVLNVLTFKKNRKPHQLPILHKPIEKSAVNGLPEDITEVKNELNALKVTYDNTTDREVCKHLQHQPRRLVFKDGACNVSLRNVRKRRMRYLVDLFTTLVDMRWRYNFIIFGVSFLGSWSVFGFLWWIVAIGHGDHLSSNNTSWEPCVTGVYDFPSAFLFSVETQHTTGYGTRVIESHCQQGIVLLIIQACCGIFIQALMTGIIFAKLSRPKTRSHTMLFSRHAVICLRDDEYCLLFRLGDMRNKHLVDTSIRALLVTDKRTKEGETIPLCQYNFAIETETNFQDSFVFLAWPITVVHRIVPGSPLWELSAEQLANSQFEIIVILEGVVESTGYCIQIRTSYLPSEILWGHRLAPLVTYKNCSGHYDIDFYQFDNVVPVSDMPECSAKDYLGKRAECSAFNKDKEYPFSFTSRNVCCKAKQRLMRKRKPVRSKSSAGGKVTLHRKTSDVQSRKICA